MSKSKRRRKARSDDESALYKRRKTGSKPTGPRKSLIPRHRTHHSNPFRNRNTGKSPLLNLPPELRNVIYRYALCSKEAIIVDENKWQQPALLRTCRQIRKETSALYYLDNEFLITVDDFDSSTATAWWQHAWHWFVYNPKARFWWYAPNPSNDLNWQNVLLWLERCHRGVCVGMAVDAYMNSAQVVVAWMHMIRNENAARPWEEVKKLVETFKEGLMLGRMTFIQWK